MIKVIIYKKDGTQDEFEFINEIFLNKFLTEYISEYLKDRKLMELQMDIIRK